jgi:hypothetical protein
MVMHPAYHSRFADWKASEPVATGEISVLAVHEEALVEPANREELGFRESESGAARPPRPER